MLKEIIDNINERIKGQPDSRCASADEVRICWLICEIEILNNKIKKAKNYLVGSEVSDPIDTILNTYKILNEEK